MIKALVTGTIKNAPKRGFGKTGNEYTSAGILVESAEGNIWCNLIAFNEAANRLAQLKEGSYLAVSGKLTIASYTNKAGECKPSISLLADEIASTSKKKPIKKIVPSDFGDAAGDLNDIGV